jgi:hypothetical protein
MATRPSRSLAGFASRSCALWRRIGGAHPAGSTARSRSRGGVARERSDAGAAVRRGVVGHRRHLDGAHGYVDVESRRTAGITRSQPHSGGLPFQCSSLRRSACRISRVSRGLTQCRGRALGAVVLCDRFAALEGRRGIAVRAVGRAIQIRAGAADPGAVVRRQLRRLEPMVLAKERGDQLEPYLVAVFHAESGDTDRAFAALDRAIAAQSSNSLFAFVDPRLDFIRNDPRFIDRLDQMRFIK